MYVYNLNILPKKFIYDKVIKIIAVIFIYINQAYAQIDAGDDIIICDIENVNLSLDYTPNSIGTSDYSIENIP